MRTILLAGVLACAALAAAADTRPPASVRVDGAWARATVAGQGGTGAYMTLTATQATTLVGVSSPAARVAEVHRMKMDGDIMVMEPVEKLALAAGRSIEFKPGGHHVMLMGLAAPLKPGSTVPLTLTFRDKAGRTSELALQVPVALVAPAPAGAAPRKP